MQTEGIDIEEPAGVALAGLVQAIKQKKVDKDDYILLNISGGGFKRLQDTMSIHEMPSSLVVNDPEEELEEVFDTINRWI